MPIERIQGFAISKKPYSINPESFVASSVGETHDFKETGNRIWRVEVDSIWFRRKGGVIGAHFGQLWSTLTQADTPTLDDMIARYSSKRYGGNVIARWDGRSLWTFETMSWDEESSLKSLLDPALANFPSPPSGYDGWFVLTEP